MPRGSREASSLGQSSSDIRRHRSDIRHRTCIRRPGMSSYSHAITRHVRAMCDVRRSRFRGCIVHVPGRPSSTTTRCARGSPRHPSARAGQRGTGAIDRSIDRSIGRSVHRSIDPSIGRSIGPSVHRSIGPSIHRSIGRSIDRSIDRSRPGGRKAEWLTAGTGARGTEDEDDRRRGPTRI